MTTITFIHTDHLGSPIAATNEDGSVKWREEYQPFGKQLADQDSDNNVGFTGHKDDKDLGLTYMQARWYDPEVGRFNSLDPIKYRDIQTFSRFIYASNNPFKYIDPDGRDYIAVNMGNALHDLISGKTAKERAQAQLERDAIVANTIEQGATYTGIGLLIDTVVTANEIIKGEDFEDDLAGIMTGEFMARTAKNVLEKKLKVTEPFVEVFSSIIGKHSGDIAKQLVEDALEQKSEINIDDKVPVKDDSK
ncbi:RHS repeat domain-containing protein [Pleionea litopenaei]|uniref:RHS repeat-associated core domain-containing protein n=1 Tax=Pleionea litopenaei TaxID=3070815 RepID=A0AA51RSI9_9GAMM|nr:RHS repeat-associated core domain-containing protein [Pleionea sp. HL-JVS1]WMS86699.1 RHS repeat-associated core domain-containing protein [Pleionea sp. HL-JVS1]